MPDKLSFKNIFHTLERAISITQQRHSLISSNISNLETPNFKAKNIDFQTALAQTLKSDHEINLAKTNSRHMGQGTNSPHSIETFEEKGEWNGYNWVDIDKEMTRLAENNLRYRTATETLLRKIAILREVIREGGR